MSLFRLALLGLVAGSVVAPQVAGAQSPGQVQVFCKITVRVCVGPPPDPDCNDTVVNIPCPGTGSGHLAYKEALVKPGQTVKEGSACAVQRTDGGQTVTVNGKAQNGMCEFDHPFP
jgi:hypothetical protein